MVPKFISDLLFISFASCDTTRGGDNKWCYTDCELKLWLDSVERTKFPKVCLDLDNGVLTLYNKAGHVVYETSLVIEEIPF